MAFGDNFMQGFANQVFPRCFGEAAEGGVGERNDVVRSGYRGSGYRGGFRRNRADLGEIMPRLRTAATSFRLHECLCHSARYAGYQVIEPGELFAQHEAFTGNFVLAHLLAVIATAHLYYH